jgi:hypothetical protein
MLTEQNSVKAKTFVSSLSSWSATPVNDASEALRGGLHSIQVKESMRHAYVQAKTALQRQSAAERSDDGAGSGLISSVSGEAQPYNVYGSSPYAGMHELGELQEHELRTLQQAQDTSQPDWEASYSVVSSATRPTPSAGHGMTEPSGYGSVMDVSHQHGGQIEFLSKQFISVYYALSFFANLILSMNLVLLQRNQTDKSNGFT